MMLKKIKQISVHLKKAAAIWNYCAENLYPIEVTKEFQVIPEVFRDMAAILSSLALTNAQEFMVQLAVQTDKSSAITAKLAQGVADKLASLDKQAEALLSSRVELLSSDFRKYLHIRSSLYKAIAYKYQGKFVREKEKWGDCVTYFKAAQTTLKGIEFPKKKKPELTSHLEALSSSIQRQLGSVNTLLESARRENESIYHDLEKPIEQLDRIDGLFKVQVDSFKQ